MSYLHNGLHLHPVSVGKGGRCHQVPQSCVKHHSGFSVLCLASPPGGAVQCGHLQPLKPISEAVSRCLASVREGALPGSTLWLQIQHNGSPSHKPGLHGRLEAFGATFCPVCLQTPEKREQVIINCGSINAMNFGPNNVQGQTKIMYLHIRKL